MLKFSKREKLWLYSNYGSQNLEDFSEVRSADPQFNFTIFPKDKGHRL